MTKYMAEFPMKWGDQATRTYLSKAIAIREAKKHLKNYRGCESTWCEVWEIEFDDNTKRFISREKVFEMESSEI